VRGKADIDPRIWKLFDGYVHGSMTRREFLDRAARFTASGVSAATILSALSPDYALARQVDPADPSISVAYKKYASPKGAGVMRGYFARPAKAGHRLPGVVVIHENRGLNPYIEDVARRLAVAGFIAFAPDALTPLGGYPGNDDDGRALQAGLDQAKLRTDLLNSARFLKAHEMSTGRLAATGFCFGGGVVNYLAAALGPDMQAGAPYYGVAAASESVAKIRAPLLCHLAEHDPRVNATYPAFEAALRAAGVPYEVHVYPGTQHGFHNDSTPRYNEAAAKLSWERTVAHFRKHLA
jgi:carboxymethylenebutenolidase